LPVARSRSPLEALGRDVLQEALARAADVSTGTVSKLEEKPGMDPAWSTVCKLADALGVSTEAFRGKAAKRTLTGHTRLKRSS
jgi:DNA-binding XRE family transcriptional regulator